MAQQTALSVTATPGRVQSFVAKAAVSIASGLVNATLAALQPEPTFGLKQPEPTFTGKQPEPVFSLDS